MGIGFALADPSPTHGTQFVQSDPAFSHASSVCPLGIRRLQHSSPWKAIATTAARNRTPTRRMECPVWEWLCCERILSLGRVSHYGLFILRPRKSWSAAEARTRVQRMTQSTALCHDIVTMICVISVLASEGRRATATSRTCSIRRDNVSANDGPMLGQSGASRRGGVTAMSRWAPADWRCNARHYVNHKSSSSRRAM
jgi:hypothetical protein